VATTHSGGAEHNRKPTQLGSVSVESCATLLKYHTLNCLGLAEKWKVFTFGSLSARAPLFCYGVFYIQRAFTNTRF
jgi:hypothetical protein